MNAYNKPSVLELINLNESSSFVAFAGCAAMGMPVVPLAGVRTSVAAGGGRGGAWRGPVHRQWPQPKHGLRHLCGQPGALPKDPSAPSAALRHRASHPSHAVLQTSHPDDSLYSSGFSHTSSFLILVLSVIIAHYLSSCFSCSNIKTKPWPCSPVYLTMSTLCPYILCPFSLNPLEPYMKPQSLLFIIFPQTPTHSAQLGISGPSSYIVSSLLHQPAPDTAAVWSDTAISKKNRWHLFFCWFIFGPV